LAFRLAGAGMKVAVVERRLVGGTCVNTACTPTKALVASAYAARTARRAAEYGMVIGGDIGIDMRRVKARADAIVAASRDGLTSALQNTANITLYRGHARFAAPQAVEIAGERLRAGRIFINVGGRALVPPMSGINEVPYLTNSSMMDVDFLPQHLVIVGGSYIGLEFGQMYCRFGSRVTIIEMAPRLVRHEDEDVSAAIKDIVEREGVEVRLNAECISLAKRGDEIVAKVDCTDGAPEVAGSHLLLAVGRRPNTDDLGLDKAGVPAARDQPAKAAARRRLTTEVERLRIEQSCKRRDLALVNNLCRGAKAPPDRKVIQVKQISHHCGSMDSGFAEPRMATPSRRIVGQSTYLPAGSRSISSIEVARISELRALGCGQIDFRGRKRSFFGCLAKCIGVGRKKPAAAAKRSWLKERLLELAT
jgi:hypothetical protein